MFFSTQLSHMKCLVALPFSYFWQDRAKSICQEYFFKGPSSCHSAASGFWIKMEPKGAFGTIQSTLSAARRKVCLWNQGFHQNTEHTWILQSVLTMPVIWKWVPSRQEQPPPPPFLSPEPLGLFFLNLQDTFWGCITFSFLEIEIYV